MKCASFTMALGLLLAGSPACGQDVGTTGDPDAGAIVFKKCMACHQVGEKAKNSTGPVLNGIVDRPAATYPRYSYSKAAKEAALIWNKSNLMRYLRAPREIIPGTRMAFAGLKKDREILDIIAYLEQFDAEGRRATP